MADCKFAYDYYEHNLAAATGPTQPKPLMSAAAEEKTSSHYLRLRGLPYSAKEDDIKSFFDGLSVNEVHFQYNAEGRASGECFVGFATVADAENGLLRDKNKIGSRYIEVFRIGEVEYNRVQSGGGRSQPTPGYGGGGGPYSNSGYSGYYKPMGGPPPSQHGMGGSIANVIRARGLPYSCKKEELIGFFGGFTVDEVVFGKELGDGGRPTGEAYVRFRTVEDATSAMELNGQHLGSRYLELFHSDLDQYEQFKRQMSSSAMPLNAIQTQAPWYAENNYGWDSYAPPPPPPRGRGGYGGRGRGGGGGPYRGGYGAPQHMARAAPYDYHGRMYGGGESMGGYDSGYDNYGYNMQQQYGGGGGHPEINYAKIYLRGLPFRVTGQQISDFFAPLNCIDIKLGYLPDGRTSGDGFVEFESVEEAQQALQKDRQSINNRYIEIFQGATKTTPGTTYKRVGGSVRPPTNVPPQNPAYQW